MQASLSKVRQFIHLNLQLEPLQFFPQICNFQVLNCTAEPIPTDGRIRRASSPKTRLTLSQQPYTIRVEDTPHSTPLF